MYGYDPAVLSNASISNPNVLHFSYQPLPYIQGILHRRNIVMIQINILYTTNVHKVLERRCRVDLSKLGIPF